MYIYTRTLAVNGTRKKYEFLDHCLGSLRNVGILPIMQKRDNFILRLIEWLYHALFFVTPLLFTWFNDELFEFNKMMLVYAISSVVGGLWLIRAVLRRHFHWQQTPFDIPIALFILSQLLATLFSIHIRTSIFGYYGRFHGGLLSLFSYITLWAVYLQTFDHRHFWKFAKTLALSSIIVAAVAIPEHFGRSMSCVFVNSHQLSETQPLTQVLSPQQLWKSYNVSCWVQDVQSRVFATFGQPNWLAAYAVTLLPLFAVLSAVRQKNERLLYQLTSGTLFLSLLFTKSRSGILGWGISIVWFGVVLAIWWWRKDRKQKTSQLRPYAPILGGGVAVWAVLVLLLGTPYTPSLQSYFTKQEQPVVTEEITSSVNRLEEGGTDSGEIRKIVWAGALNVWKKYPILGSGVETFAYSYYFGRQERHNLVSEWDHLYNKAHNEFLNFLATTGVVGLASYLVLLGSFIGIPLYFGLKKKGTSPQSFLVLLSLSTGVVGLTVSNVLGFSTVMVGVLMMLFPAFAWHLYQMKTQPKIIDEQELQPRQWFWTVLIALFMIVALLFVWRAWRADHLLAKGKYFNKASEYADALETLENAYQLSTGEGGYIQELADIYSRFSAAFYAENQASTAAVFRTASKEKIDELMRENPYNLNFYKTKARVLATLAEQDPELIQEAITTLEDAQKLAPTDIRVRYNLGLLRLSVGSTEAAQAEFDKTLEMRPLFVEGRMSKAKLYADQGKLDQAITEYKYLLENVQPNNEIAQEELAKLQMRVATSGAQPQREK
jgi:putative inorganic carbon (hco3(-)) transporter